MRALITGAPGFVGNHLARLLIHEGAQIWGTTIGQHEKMDEDIAGKVELLTCDIRDKQQVQSVVAYCRPNCIFHLAAQSNVARSWENPGETFAINVMGTINLLDEVVRLGSDCRTLLIGSAEEYGKLPPEQMPIDESTPLKPANPYGSSKAAVSMLFKQYHVKYGLPVILARSFNHIGPGQAPGFVVPDFARQIAQIETGLREPVISVGNLDARRDFTSVKDVVKAYFLLITRGLPGEVYNVASGQAVMIQQILDILLSKARKDITVTQDPSKMRPSDVPLMYGDITKIKTQTGWGPLEPMENCLDEILEYWRHICVSFPG